MAHPGRQGHVLDLAYADKGGRVITLAGAVRLTGQHLRHTELIPT